MRSFNYTGRKKITHNNILLAIYTNNENLNTFNAEFDLTEYDFPNDSKVVVEAYHQANWMRFNFGTILKQTSPDDTNLIEFDDIDNIRFRVKVTDINEDKILGLADKIKPILNEEIESKYESILPIKNSDLHGAIWKVDYSDDRPILIIDKTIGDKYTVFLDTEFLTLVVPSVLREIIIRIFLYEKDFDLDDMDDWRSQWVDFCKRLSANELPDDKADIEEKYDWIDDIVSRFCRTHKMLEKLNRYREEADK